VALVVRHMTHIDARVETEHGRRSGVRSGGGPAAVPNATATTAIGTSATASS
jgi:hypothetical protein